MKLPFEQKHRELLVKRKIDGEFGVYPEERSVDELIHTGIVNINKVSGPSSHQVTDYVKKILCIGKAGHSGTLDPLVTGVLPIALEKNTRIVQVLLNAGKEYVCLMHLHKDISEDLIRKEFEKFKGKIIQLPPVRSAVKREVREREIYYVEVLEIDGRDILFRIGCQAGTYIRKYVHDFGLSLGCNANMIQLIRTKIGGFNDNNWCSLHDLKDAYETDKEKLRSFIFPVEKAVHHLGKIYVSDKAIPNLVTGSNLYVMGICKLDSGIEKDDTVAIMSLKGELICIGSAVMNSSEMIDNEKGLAVKCKKVFMKV